MQRRKIVCLGILVATLLAGCTSGDDDDSSEVQADDTETTGSTVADGAEVTGPAPGRGRAG